MGKNKQRKGGPDTKIKIRPSSSRPTSGATMVGSCEPGEPTLQERAWARRSGRSSKNELWLGAADGAWGIGLLAFGISRQVAEDPTASDKDRQSWQGAMRMMFNTLSSPVKEKMTPGQLWHELQELWGNPQKVGQSAAFCLLLLLFSSYSLFRSDAVGPGYARLPWMCQIECQIENYGRPWEDALHAVARPGADGVSDGVWLFCLCMIRCLVHPVDYIVDVLTQ
jgi:hypothetical protein